ncbi:helix-turn-helix transcriptional regulator [Rossellomorea marisflavi]|uniref:helix-turn-helix transcriptional regulator n=1 Tax=Rossellomorea marisflavi TaxID=189381 RepID=UPI0034575EB8
MKLVEIGKKICELRNEMNLTQGELAEGICTQALISLIEKGESDPNATILYQIAKKLGVDVNYFFHIGSTPRLDYVHEVEKQVRKLRVVYQYKEMMDIVRTEEKNPLFYNDPQKLQFLYWHKSIYYFEVEKDHEKAEYMLKKAFDIFPRHKRAHTEIEMEMMMTRCNYRYQIGQYENVVELYSKLEHILVGTKRILTNKSIKTRFYYNLARAHTRLGHFGKSLALLEEGIDWCIECEELYLMPPLHYLTGYTYELMENYEKALEYLDYSIQLYDLTPGHPVEEFLSEKRSTYMEVLRGKA